jgi:hypothetical protein
MLNGPHARCARYDGRCSSLHDRYMPLIRYDGCAADAWSCGVVLLDVLLSARDFEQASAAARHVPG